MSRISPALAYLVIYNPTLQPNPDDLTEGRDEDDVTEQAHVLFYTARERAVSRDRILRQVGLAKALANFAEMFTSQPGFDNVHAQKSRLIMISPEPDFWIHACVNLAKTPKVTSTTSGGDQPEEFDYHGNSLNDEVLRTQLLQAYQSFRLQQGGFTQIMQADGVRFLERRLESFFTPWAWQWNVGATPEFGNYLGLSVHPLKKQFTNSLADYTQRVPNTPTLLLVPPHIVTDSKLPPIYPLLPLARLLEPLVPLPPLVASPQPSPAIATSAATSAPMHMLATGGNVVTKYITKPAAQVVDPRNWSWPTLPFGKGSIRAKGKDRKVSTDIRVETNSEPQDSSGAASVASSGPNPSKDHLGLPTDEAISKASRSVSPSTIDHESLLDAQLDMITNNNTNTPVDPVSIPLPSDSDSELTTFVDTEAGDLREGTQSIDQTLATHILVDHTLPSDSNGTSNLADENTTEGEAVSTSDREHEHASNEPTSESLQATPIAIAHVGLPAEDPTPAPSAVTSTVVQVQSSTHIGVETTSGSVSVWLDSPTERVGLDTAQKQRITWLAIPGLLVASVTGEEDEDVWRSAAQRLLVAVHETIQRRRLTAA
ncbi:unnamed protein product [Rhizoctonia solani]|nr:unnamed protein product [Rhizoctonia solani]